MRKWLIEVLEGWLRRLGWVAPIQTKWIEPAIDRQIRDAALFWVLKYEEDRTTSGEYKRHQIYSKLIKQFPDTPKYLLGLAIEVCVWQKREEV